MKKMKSSVFINTAYKSSMNFGNFKSDKKYKEDDNKSTHNVIKVSGTTEDPKKKIGVKSIRKIIRQLNEKISPEEIQLMIWVI